MTHVARQVEKVFLNFQNKIDTIASFLFPIGKKRDKLIFLFSFVSAKYTKRLTVMLGPQQPNTTQQPTCL
jgi:hypothetical protein